ncbi:hypothetical protein M758_7G108800 [Ceratodon purpureus]|uniref:Uncharacterized protein n=1 Tax=Ceratodon purpureus TaxID=3225 RepID=A0A8T0HCI7_CERPU|nr:hypothetical protein KC19_7G167400 [Ceratodon purpureus]KAG0611026.1 hypothetical protein M758_7G108800 [Ceratodon purpureus]
MLTLSVDLCAGCRQQRGILTELGGESVFLGVCRSQVADSRSSGKLEPLVPFFGKSVRLATVVTFFCAHRWAQGRQLLVATIYADLLCCCCDFLLLFCEIQYGERLGTSLGQASVWASVWVAGSQKEEALSKW